MPMNDAAMEDARSSELTVRSILSPVQLGEAVGKLPLNRQDPVSLNASADDDS